MKFIFNTFKTVQCLSELELEALYFTEQCLVFLLMMLQFTILMVSNHDLKTLLGHFGMVLDNYNT